MPQTNEFLGTKFTAGGLEWEVTGTTPFGLLAVNTETDETIVVPENLLMPDNNEEDTEHA